MDTAWDTIHKKISELVERTEEIFFVHFSFFNKLKAIYCVIFCAYNGMCTIIYKFIGQLKNPNINNIIEPSCVLLPNSHFPALLSNMTTFWILCLSYSCFLKIVDYTVSIPKQYLLSFACVFAHIYSTSIYKQSYTFHLVHKCKNFLRVHT